MVKVEAFEKLKGNNGSPVLVPNLNIIHKWVKSLEADAVLKELSADVSTAGRSKTPTSRCDATRSPSTKLRLPGCLAKIHAICPVLDVMYLMYREGFAQLTFL